MISTIRVVIKSDIPAFRREFKALIKELEKAQKRSPYTFVLEIDSSLSSPKLPLFDISPAEVSDTLREAHFLTEPRVYSKQINSGGPLLQRTNVVRKRLQALINKRAKLMTRERAQALYSQQSSLPVFSGRTGAALNSSILQSLRTG